MAANTGASGKNQGTDELRMKKKSKSKPHWYITTRELNQWKKAQGVYVLSGGIAQLVFIDLTDPIGIMLQRPVKLSKEEGVIIGTFIINEPQVRDTKKTKHPARPYYIVSVYNQRAKAFMYVVPGQFLPQILDHPDIRYICGEERERARAALRLECQPL